MRSILVLVATLQSRVLADTVVVLWS